MKDTKYTKPKGMKYRVKGDLIFELSLKSYIKYQNMSLWPEMYKLEEVQTAALENGIEIFQNKKVKTNS